SSNPTWIIVGSIAGGLAAIGLLSVVGGLLICYSKSRIRFRTTIKTPNNRNSIPLRPLAN
ncbi:unnamed protein product, partial [Rotaria sp. Silwood2]